MNFTWHEKENAIIESMTPSTGTLRPDKESSKNWDNTDNLYIEGDNLEVLKLLQKSYFGKVKMIYIDPPYNTGKDFVYKDNFKDNIANYKEITNQSTKANSETNGRYHTDWLNMMYPRLKLARNLLKDDGAIFISIDDNEVYNLKKICDEVYGEDNYIGTFSWVKTETPSNLSNKIKESVEYILCYEKSRNNNKFKGLSKISKSSNGLMNQTNSEKALVFPKNIVDTGISDGIIKAGIYGTKSYKIELLEDCEVKDGYFITPIKLRGKFKWGQEKLNREIEECNTKISIRTIALSPSYEKEEYEAESPWNIINKKFGVGTNEDASNEIEDLMGKKLFSYPKPVSLLKYIANFIVDKNDLVLDFFSGSATTAHAVMELNAADEGNRKFIMVQLPELLEESSEAYKEGYRNLCEIGKERIRRAGKKIVEENKDKEGIEDLDMGFKVFKLEYNYGGEDYLIMKEGIKVDIIKRPKDKPICKFKICGELYYLVKTGNDIIVFSYKSSIKGKVIASIFNIELCKDKDYMQLEYLYNMKLNEFNGEDFIHSQYVTSVILDNVYQNLKD